MMVNKAPKEKKVKPVKVKAVAVPMRGSGRVPTSSSDDDDYFSSSSEDEVEKLKAQ